MSHITIVHTQNMTVSEKEKMLAGELYLSTDPQLQSALAEAQTHLRRLNAHLRRAQLELLLGSIGDGTQLKSPFSCDYGQHIRIGRNGFVNYGCVFLDCNFIEIGDDAQIGPGVHIYTAFHPLDSNTRRSGLEGAKQSRSGTTSGSEEVAYLPRREHWG